MSRVASRLRAGVGLALLIALLSSCGDPAGQAPGAAQETPAPPCSPADLATAEQVLADHPGHGVLVGAAQILEAGVAKRVTYETHAREIVTIHLHLRPREAVEPGTGPTPATPEEMTRASAPERKVSGVVDAEGVFVLVVEGGTWRVTGHGVGIRTRDGRESDLGKLALRWAPPDAIDVVPGEVVCLPGISYVAPVRIEGPAPESRHAVSEPPALRWTAYPGAASYEIQVRRIDRVEGGTSTREWSTARVDHPVTELPWSTVEAKVPAYQRIGGPSASGEYAWTVRAVDAEGTELSSGQGPSFQLIE